jgi:peptide/nickel transport system ATP-binding protein
MTLMKASAAKPLPDPAVARDTAVPLLQVSGLKTHFFTRAGVVKAVDGVDLQLGPGEILGLVGESGSGKSITGFSLIGLLDEPGRIVDGSDARIAR